MSLQYKPSNDVQVNSFTSGDQNYSEIAALKDGGWVITWQSMGQDDNSWDVYAQRYDRFGNEIENEFRVNNVTENDQYADSITALNDGWVITWTSDGQDGDGLGVFGQSYNSDGSRNGDPFQVNETTEGLQAGASITALNDGGFGVAWTQNVDFGVDDHWDIFARRFYANGDTNGSEFKVNTDTLGWDPTLIELDNGGTVISWTTSVDGSYDIYAQMYDSDLTKYASEFLVNSSIEGNQSHSSITPINDANGYVITWQSLNNYGVYMQGYDANGDKLGPELEVNIDSSSSNATPVVTRLTNGNVVIVWTNHNQNGSDDGIYAKIYDTTGNQIGEEIEVNSYTYSHQYEPSIAALKDGGFVISWSSLLGQDGDSSGIFATRFDAEGNNIPFSANNVTGTTADDILNGTTDIDEISTGLGADVVYALAGSDTITLTADTTFNVSGFSARNVSNDNSVGTNQRISLEGLNRFNDVIDGGDGVDTLILTSGNDVFFIDDVYSEHHSSLTLSSTTQGIVSTARMIDLETINAGDGNDIVDLTSDNFVLTSGVSINGEAGNDTLWGSNGADTIDGGAGDDSLFGGAGDDAFTGGSGSDTFQFTATAGSDVITDFDTNNDAIQIYYRAQDNHSYDDLSLSNGVLTWNYSGSTENFVDLNGVNDQLFSSGTGWTGSGAWYDGEIYVGPHISSGGDTPDGDGYYVRNDTGQSSSKYAITKEGENTITNFDRGDIEFTCDWASNTDLGVRFVALVDGTWYASDQFGTNSNDHGDMNANDVTAWEVGASVHADNDNWYASLAEAPDGGEWRDGEQWSSSPAGHGLPSGDITQFGIAWLHTANHHYGAVDNFIVSGDNVLIDMSTGIASSNLSDIDSLITFVEII